MTVIVVVLYATPHQSREQRDEMEYYIANDAPPPLLVCSSTPISNADKRRIRIQIQSAVKRKKERRERGKEDLYATSSPYTKTHRTVATHGRGAQVK
jgi:hypothetical protein